MFIDFDVVFSFSLLCGFCRPYAREFAVTWVVDILNREEITSKLEHIMWVLIKRIFSGFAFDSNGVFAVR